MKEDVLPEGWELKKLGSVVQYEKGKKPSNLNDEKNDIFTIPYIDIQGFEKGIIKSWTDGKNARLCQNSDLLMVWDGARAGLVGSGSAGALGSTLMKISFPKVNHTYGFYFLYSKFSDINSNTKGTGIPHVDPSVLWNFEFPIPPLPEQQYLSKKLTALLDEVAQTKQRLEAIPALLKQFRQSVLADAVSGKLTEENFEPENLKKLAETDVIIKTGPFGSALHKEEYISDGIPVINPIHISNGNIIPSSEMSISQDKFSKLSRWQLKKDEVILGRRGEMGRAAVIVENMLPMLCGTGSIVLSSRQILSKYLALILRSPTAVNFFNQSSVGSTMVNLNQKIIKELEVYIPPKKQQTQIVQKVETYFALADEIETQVNAALENVNLLTQSILAKAFSGELSAAWRKENSQLIQIRNNNE